MKTMNMPLAELKPHPRNYRDHPADQLEHIKKSIQEHGFYRAIVIAKDKTILAGHGVYQASQELELETVPVVQINIDPMSPQALKLLVGDNSISQLADVNDRALTEMLKELLEADDLLGSGFTAEQLAVLTMVTRHHTEIENFDAAAEWVGMPDYDVGGDTCELHINFDTEEQRLELMALAGIPEDMVTKHAKHAKRGKWSTWWPPREKDNTIGVQVVADTEAPEGE